MKKIRFFAKKYFHTLGYENIGCFPLMIGKQKKPILFKVTEPSSIPYRTVRHGPGALACTTLLFCPVEALCTTPRTENKHPHDPRSVNERTKKSTAHVKSFDQRTRARALFRSRSLSSLRARALSLSLALSFARALSVALSVSSRENLSAGLSRVRDDV